METLFATLKTCRRERSIFQADSNVLLSKMPPSTLPMQSPERAVFSTHGDTYHAEENVLRASIFVLTQKKLRKLLVFAEKFLGSVSLVRPLKPILLCFPACWKSQMRTSQTRLSTCLFVTLPFHHLNAASWQSSSPNQSQDAEKPYHIEQIKAKTWKGLTNTRNEIWKLVILHLFFA